MISEAAIKQIVQIFCGDIQGYYSYKTGPQLVSFFNQYYRANDQYHSGFQSRWAYVYDKLVDLLNTRTIDSFFNTTLGKAFLMRDLGITEVEAVEKMADFVVNSG